MSLQTRLTALAQAVGADIKDLKTKSAVASVASAQQIFEMGMPNQIRAGRQFTAADFTNMGLSTPIGLWNLSNVNDSSGNGRSLVNKGTVVFDRGILNTALTAARFSGTVGQGFYITDTGAADPFRIRTGSMGCWFKTAKRGTAQILLGKWGTASQNCWIFYINSANQLHLDYSFNGTGVGGPDAISDVCDHRWHFGVATFDGAAWRIYCDGELEITFLATGMLFEGSSAFAIGIGGMDAANNGATPHFGRIDEAFVTADILSDDQVRNLYCARMTHTLGVVPTRAFLNIRRQSRGATHVIGDYGSQPRRLYNFAAGALTDEGTNAVTLTNNGGVVSCPGADGIPGNGVYLAGAQSLSSTDAGLPLGNGQRSYGCWFRTSVSSVAQGLIGWGVGQGDARMVIEAGGSITAWTSSNDLSIGGITSPFVADGLWHHVVVVEDNAPIDGLKQKLYLDGRMVASGTVLGTLSLGGADRFRIGARPNNTAFFTGQIDGVFAHIVALTSEAVHKLYDKGGSQTLAPSPKNAGDHVEAMSATEVLVAFDTLESINQVDLMVAA